MRKPPINPFEAEIYRHRRLIDRNVKAGGPNRVIVDIPLELGFNSKVISSVISRFQQVSQRPNPGRFTGYEITYESGCRNGSIFRRYIFSKGAARNQPWHDSQ